MQAEFCGVPVDGKTFGDLWYLGNCIEAGIEVDQKMIQEIMEKLGENIQKFANREEAVT